MNTNDMTTNMQYGAALTRLTLGTLMLSHGLLKVMVFTIPGTAAYFESLGLPPIAAYLTIFGEIAGGAALILGVLTRLVALLSIPLLLGATWAHSANGWVFSAAGGGWEFPAFLVAIAVVVAVQGGGAFSLGRVLTRHCNIPTMSLA
jgi:putative oxidoreductase